MKKDSIYPCFQVFSNELRFKIISLLFEKELSVLEICSKLKAEQSNVSHALNVLRKCNFVAVKRKGKKHFYFVPEEVKKLFSLDKKFKAKNIFELMEKHHNFCKKECQKVKK